MCVRKLVFGRQQVLLSANAPETSNSPGYPLTRQIDSTGSKLIFAPHGFARAGNIQVGLVDPDG